MSLTDALIKKTHDKKENELFDVHPKVTARPRQPQDLATRQQNWESLFKSMGDDFWVERDPEKPNALSLCFSNGLRIEDNDTDGVAFWANENKSYLKEDAAIQTVRMAANHLYRRGDVMEIGSVYGGSTPYIKAFEAATKEARKHISTAQLATLKANQSPAP